MPVSRVEKVVGLLAYIEPAKGRGYDIIVVSRAADNIISQTICIRKLLLL